MGGRTQYADGTRLAYSGFICGRQFGSQTLFALFPVIATRLRYHGLLRSFAALAILQTFTIRAFALLAIRMIHCLRYHGLLRSFAALAILQTFAIRAFALLAIRLIHCLRYHGLLRSFAALAILQTFAIRAFALLAHVWAGHKTNAPFVQARGASVFDLCISNCRVVGETYLRVSAAPCPGGTSARSAVAELHRPADIQCDSANHGGCHHKQQEQDRCRIRRVRARRASGT